MFGLHYIKPGIVDVEDGKLYSRLFRMRLTGDYEDDYDLLEEDVLPYMEPVEQFISRMRVLLAEDLNTNNN